MAKGLLLITAAIAGAASAQPAPAPTPPEETIVVTGRRLSDTERTLAACLARNCPPNEDVDASLAHAENLFVAGDYKEARRTTRASLARNRKHASAFPEPVSDLERSNGRLSAHLGEKQDYQQSTWGIRRALRAGLPADDPRLVGADIEVAQMLAATGRDALARDTYNDAIKDATRIGRPDLAAAAKLRLAYFDMIAGDEVGGRRAVRALAESTDPKLRGTRIAAMLLLAQDDRKRGKPDRTDALIAELRTAGLTQPVLVFAPEVRLADASPIGEGAVRSGLRSLATNNYEKRWIDVGFWVRPDGRVEEADVLRASGDASWSQPLMKSIKGRLYSPVGGNDAQGAYRIERYTFTSFWDTTTGSRMRTRGPNARIEYLDLTPVPAT